MPEPNKSRGSKQQLIFLSRMCESMYIEHPTYPKSKPHSIALSVCILKSGRTQYVYANFPRLILSDLANE